MQNLWLGRGPGPGTLEKKDPKKWDLTFEK